MGGSSVTVMKPQRFPLLLFFVALSSLFLFPWKLTLIFVFIASLFAPPVGIIIGVLADALYGAAPPLFLATGLGVLFSAFGFFVQHFIKTRIIR